MGNGGNDPSLNLYLWEIGETPLLTPAEERNLAKRIHDGDQDALEGLIKANLRFVVSVAKQYQNQGLPLLDLIGEGNIGLIKAAKRFDGTRGFKFITFAVWWVRQKIIQALAEQSRIVRLPLNRVGTLHKIGKISSSLEQEYGREPFPNEIAEQLELSEAEVADTLKISNTHLSLDAPFSPRDDNSLIDVLEDKFQPSPDKALLKKSLRLEIEKALDSLTPREAEVINFYFGLGDREALTLEEIGARFLLTRERVRQIKEKAIRRLRHGNHSTRLKRFFSDATTDRYNVSSSTRSLLPMRGGLTGIRPANMELIKDNERRGTAIALSTCLEAERAELASEVKRLILLPMQLDMIRLYFGLIAGIKPLRSMYRVGQIFNGLSPYYYVKQKLAETPELFSLRNKLEYFRDQVMEYDNKEKLEG